MEAIHEATCIETRKEREKEGVVVVGLELGERDRLLLLPLWLPTAFSYQPPFLVPLVSLACCKLFRARFAFILHHCHHDRNVAPLFKAKSYYSKG